MRPEWVLDSAKAGRWLPDTDAQYCAQSRWVRGVRGRVALERWRGTLTGRLDRVYVLLLGWP